MINSDGQRESQMAQSKGRNQRFLLSGQSMDKLGDRRHSRSNDCLLAANDNECEAEEVGRMVHGAQPTMLRIIWMVRAKKLAAQAND